MLIELALLAVVATLVVMGMRYGKTAVLDKQIIVHQPGQYHITLAPQLHRAQVFIENIAKQFAEVHQPQGDIPTQFFEVSDPGLLVRGKSCYLLSVAFRGGTLYFQAINPQPLLRDADSHLKNLREFSESVLALHPLSEPVDGHGAEELLGVVESAAHQLQIAMKTLQETG